MPRLLSSAVCAFGLAWLCACVGPRVGFAWPLEWMEGAVREHALRLLRGQPIYAAPSGEFIAFVYPPLSYVPMGLAAALFGPALWAARLPSLLAMAVGLWFMARAAARLAGHWSAAALAAGLYAMGFGYTGGFWDLARVDACFMALLVIGCERMAARRYESGLWWFALACLAKQQAVFFLGAGLLYVLSKQLVPLRRALVVCAALALAVAGLSWWSDGWFLSYTYTVPRRHGLSPTLLASFVAVDLCVYLPILVALSATALIRLRGGRLCGCDYLFVAGVIASALGRAHPGGDDNVRMPAYAMLCLLASVAYADLTVGSPFSWRQALLSSSLLAQVAVLWQAPSLYRPTLHTERGLASLQRELSRCAEGGPSVALDHTRLNEVPFAHMLALSDLVRNRDALGTQAATAVAGALAAADAPRALAVSGLIVPVRRVIERRYELCATLPPVRMASGFSPGRTYVFRRLD